MPQKVYAVIIVEYGEYRLSHIFSSKFEADKFLRHNIIAEGWNQFIEEKEILQ